MESFEIYIKDSAPDIAYQITHALYQYEACHGKSETLDERFRQLKIDGVNACKDLKVAYATYGEKLLGGVTFIVYCDWIWLRCGWISPANRRNGIYRKLIETLEYSAKKIGISGILTSTFSWEAPVVYEHLGFTKGNVLHNCPEGNTNIDYFKEL